MNMIAVLALCVIGIVAAVLLFVVAQKFRVEEDPRIDEVEKKVLILDEDGETHEF